MRLRQPPIIAQGVSLGGHFQVLNSVADLESGICLVYKR